MTGAKPIVVRIITKSHDFPLVVADDCHGGDIFSDGRAKYCRV